jgi:hypothetical protein
MAIGAFGCFSSVYRRDYRDPKVVPYMALYKAKSGHDAGLRFAQTLACLFANHACVVHGRAVFRLYTRFAPARLGQ